MDKSRLILPISVLLGTAILGGAYYGVQATKQVSIEKQEATKNRQDQAEREKENARADLKLKQDNCEALSSGVKQKWNNALGVTYDDKLWKDCVVTYTDTETGEVRTSPLKFMQDVK
jgi:uncharacterized FlaG/YvyC family protein